MLTKLINFVYHCDGDIHLKCYEFNFPTKYMQDIVRLLTLNITTDNVNISRVGLKGLLQRSIGVMS